jgi:hypothetical protein
MTHNTVQHGSATGDFVATHLPERGIKVDNAILGCENAVMFQRISAVEYLLGETRENRDAHTP